MIENINSKIWNIKELSQAIKNTIENNCLLDSDQE